jgi:hypothetical protein
MTSTVQRVFPAAPGAVWNVLPAVVAAVPGKEIVYDAQLGVVTFRNETSWAGWGHTITAQLRPGPQGTTLTVTAKLKGGLFDWGQGKRCAGRFVAGVTAALGMPPG